MARGWESKSVEDQVAEKEAGAENGKKKKINAERERQVKDLELQRERILSERTANPHRRAALAAALEQVETQLRSV